MKNALESVGNRVDQLDKRISELKDRNTEMFWVEEKKKNFFNEETLGKRSNSIRRANTRLMIHQDLKRGKQKQRAYLKK